MGYEELDKKRIELSLLLIGVVLGAFGNIVAEDLKHIAGIDKSGVVTWWLHFFVWGTIVAVFIFLGFKIGEDSKTRWQPIVRGTLAAVMQERAITRAVALADIALIVPAVIAVERDWGLAITPLEIMLLSAIVAAAFVAVEQLHQITLSEETQ